jgi:hypothetical protein
MPKYAPELNDYIEIVGGRLRLDRLAHLHSPTPTGLEASRGGGPPSRKTGRPMLWRNRPRPIPVDESPVS